MFESDQQLLHARIRVPDHVLFQEIAAESALLDINTGVYFGLDDVGTKMWRVLVESDTVDSALKALMVVYGAPVEKIRDDLLELLCELKEHGLIKIET